MVPLKRASNLNGWLFLLVISSGFISLLLPVGRFFMEEPAAWQQFRDGELVRRLERRVDEVFILRDPSVSLWANASYLFFKAGRPGVLVGYNDWLFSREEFYFDQRSEMHLALNLTQMAVATCRLRSLGKNVLVVPVPAKRRLYADYAPRPVSMEMESLYSRVTGHWSEAGIPWVDSLAILEQAVERENVFMRTDTHWSPGGAAAVAQGVAAASPVHGNQGFLTEARQEEFFQGDLLRYLPTSHGIGPQREEVLVRYLTSAQDGVVDEGALLGDVMPEVVLVGTSYSAMEEWNFPGFLKQQLGQDVLVYALEAEGPFSAMREFLDSPAAKDERVRLVLWEVPERSLIQAMDAIVEGDNHACLDNEFDRPAEFAGMGGAGR